MPNLLRIIKLYIAYVKLKIKISETMTYKTYSLCIKFALAYIILDIGINQKKSITFTLIEHTLNLSKLIRACTMGRK